ncbi:hypothetical protein [Floccifex sp.]|uniref:hypothetical protein n=1 Tax=Floccifex sp. TaxID=2815810 RepID=UPI003EF3ACCA
MTIIDYIDSKNDEENDDFIDCSAFEWVERNQGKRFEQKRIQDEINRGKDYVIVLLLFFIGFIIVATLLNERFGIEFY